MKERITICTGIVDDLYLLLVMTRRDDDELKLLQRLLLGDVTASRDSHKEPREDSSARLGQARRGAGGPSLCGRHRRLGEVSPALDKWKWTAAPAALASGRVDDDNDDDDASVCIDAVPQLPRSLGPTSASSLLSVHSPSTRSPRRIVAMCLLRLYKAQDACNTATNNPVKSQDQDRRFQTLTIKLEVKAE